MRAIHRLSLLAFAVAALTPVIAPAQTPAAPTLVEVFDWIQAHPGEPNHWASSPTGEITLDTGAVLEPGECIERIEETSPLNPFPRLPPAPKVACLPLAGAAPVPLKGTAGPIGFVLLALMGALAAKRPRRAAAALSILGLLGTVGDANALRMGDKTPRCDYHARPSLEDENVFWIPPELYQPYWRGPDVAPIRYEFTMHSVVSYMKPATLYAFTFDFDGDSNISWATTRLPRGNPGVSYVTKKSGRRYIANCNMLIDPQQVEEISQVEGVSNSTMMYLVLLHEFGHCLALQHFDVREGESIPGVDTEEARKSVMNYAAWYEMTNANANQWLRYASGELNMITSDLSSCP